MKRLLLIVFLLIALPVQAQDASVVRNDGAADDVGSGNGFSSAISVDSKGRLWLSPSGTPSAVINALVEAVPAPMVVFQATAVPTTVPTPQFINTAALKHSFVDNSTNQEVYVHLNGSITPIARVPAGSVWFRNWGATGSKMSGSIAVTRPGTLPTSGSVAIGGDS